MHVMESYKLDLQPENQPEIYILTYICAFYFFVILYIIFNTTA
jgi:hypothetical protein